MPAITEPIPAHPLEVHFTDTAGRTVGVHPGRVLSIAVIEAADRPVARIRSFSSTVDVPLSLREVIAVLYPTAAFTQKLQDEVNECKGVRQTNLQLEHLFALQVSYMAEASRRWHIAHPGNGHYVPDLGTLLTWLLSEIDKAAAPAAEKS